MESNIFKVKGVKFCGDWKGFVSKTLAETAREATGYEWAKQALLTAMEYGYMLVDYDIQIEEKIAELVLMLVKEGKLVMYWDGRVLDDTSKLEMFDLVDPKASFAVAQVEA